MRRAHGLTPAITVEITDLNHRGEGVGRWQGQVIFVRGAIPGDVVRAELVEQAGRAGAGSARGGPARGGPQRGELQRGGLHGGGTQRRYARARLREVVTPSPDRVSPVCPVASRCGGCQLQALAYPAQLAWKERMVRETLRRVGHLEVEVAPTLGMDYPWAYRNKAIFPLGLERGRVVGGCFEPGTHRVVDVGECPLQHRLNNQVLNAGRQLVEELCIPVYDEISDSGFARHIISRVAVSRGEGMAILVTRYRLPPEWKQAKWPGDLPGRWMAAVPHLLSVYQNVNARQTNVIMGEEDILLEGRSTIEDRLLGLSFTISPRSFYQVNPVQAEAMYRLVASWAALEAGDEAVDVYCGVGTIALVLAQAGARVTGVEEVPEAVADARHNAIRNGLEGTRFLCGQAEKVLPELLEATRPAVVVLDPPRQGAKPEVLAAVARARPPRVIYVSCAPATLARDLAGLVATGYSVVRVQPVDMFPQTAHVETVVLLQTRHSQEPAS